MNPQLTGHEREVAEGVTIVSQTDLHGTITDVNDAFVQISGYSREELIGQPHNILRHPDVPKAVFADLWHTLKQGKPWVQLVKNRCKNGDHYWVEANVSPVIQKGEIIGYMSVRRRIRDDQKQAAEQLYRAVGQGKVQIKHGFVDTWAKRLSLVNRINPLFILMLMIALVSIFGILDALDIISIHWTIQVAVLSVVQIYALTINRFVEKQTKSFDHLLKAASEADFTAQVDTYSNTWLGDLASDLKRMQIQMGASFEQNKLQLNQNTRLKTALDNASTCTLVADTDHHIIYFNQAMETLLNKYQSEIRKTVAGFDVERMCEAPIETLHTDPQGFSQAVDALKGVWEEELHFGNCVIKSTVQPVINGHGERLGSVIEWTDLTQQRQVEARLDGVLSLAAKGHTDLKVDQHDLEGFYLYMANNINGLMKSLNVAIEEIVKVMAGLAQGDIAQRVEKEFSGSLAAMKGATNVSLDNLGSIIMQIRNVAEAVSLAAAESAQASDDLSNRTQQAAAALEEVNANMQSINHSQQANTQILNEVSQLAQGSVKLNLQARESMDETITAMESIKQTSERISDIIGLIDGIAFQTNLLALNAAVEAARAGEHGRGFAVVAGEVRSLAQKSAEAAGEIKSLIEEAGSRVNEGAEKVQLTHDVFMQVDQEVSKIGSELSGVVSSIEEQQHSVNEVSTTINQLDSNIQQNAALVEETSSSAEALRHQADQLHLEIGKFKVDEHALNQQDRYQGEINGVRMSDVRRNMRIWRTTTQAYLNGIRVPFDRGAAVDATACAVGRALQTLQQANPQIQTWPVWEEVERLHQRQHDMVHQALELRQQLSEHSEVAGYERLDDLMDEFSSVTHALDLKLAELEDKLLEAL